MGEIPFPGWDPVFLELVGRFGLRYYGLMYVCGFMMGQFILKKLARSGFLPMAPDKVPDLIFALILGVVLGGRAGYVLFYKPAMMWQDPLQVIMIMDGGLSFHGGLIGVILAMWYFCRRNQIPAWRVFDALPIAGCAGVFFVRIANFINGELYGRIIGKGDWEPPWAMRFPTDPEVQKYFKFEPGMSSFERERVRQAALDDGTWGTVIAPNAPLRHPSQIYEALAEGLFLGLLLWLVYTLTRKKPLGLGAYGGIFLMGYGVLRFGIEYFREPDDHFAKDQQGLGTILFGLSMGQLLCIGMILVGGWLLWRRKRLPPPTDTLQNGEGSPA